MLSVITNLISSFASSKVGQAPIPGFSQNVGELLTSKTNMLTNFPAITYGISRLSENPQDPIGHTYLIIGIGLTFLRDTYFKKD